MTNTANSGDILMGLGLETILSQFANSSTYYQSLTAIFGNQYDTNKAKILRIQWQEGDFSSLPTMEVIDGEILGNARGAYAMSNNTIYLSDRFLNTASQGTIQAVILEEIGHYLDAQINRQDTPGDEGELFSKVLRGVNLNPAEFNRILAEDDTAFISFGGKSLQVEKAEPTILLVNTTLDESDGSATVGTGLSLRDAILIANTNPNTDYEIQLTGGLTYNLTATGTGENDSRTGDLDIKARSNILYIVATGGQKATINASNLFVPDRVFQVLNGGGLSLQNLVVTGGIISAGFDTGGGIFVSSNGFLDLYNADILNNTANYFGGGIDNYGTTYLRNGSTVSNNLARPAGIVASGGGINNRFNGVLTIVDSTISNNNASNFGGGIMNDGVLSVINSTISQNTSGTGGGLASNNGTAVFDLVNVTVSGNTGDGYGGGLYLAKSGIIARISNGTITDNTAFAGGGIYVGAASVQLKNTIVASNFVDYYRGGFGKDIYGPVTGNNYNLIGDVVGASGTIGTGTDITFASAGITDIKQVLDPVLKNNGGFNLTHALVAGSPALNGGSNALISADREDMDKDGNKTEAIPFDGRGTGFNRIVGSTVDIGAFEVQTTLPILSINNLTVVEGLNTNAVLTVSLNNPSSQTITVNYSTTPVTATANSDYTSKTGTLTIAANATTGTIPIPILNDNLNENNETFTVTLSNPVNATLGNTKGIVTITDTLRRSVTTTLPANVENLQLTGTNPINGTGNARNNRITGNNGNNRLNGGLGIDTLIGGLGNDIYIVDTTTDTITELVNQGTDTIQSSVTYSIATRTNIENLTLTGTGNINGTGNTGNNRITGNSANNILAGGLGNDSLNGGDGNDTLAGNAGNDTLTGAGGIDRIEFRSTRAFVTSDFGVDTITDFAVNQDKIVLSKTTFAALTSVVGNGFSQASDFAVVASDNLAAASNAFIVYSSGTGRLFYNQNRSAAGLGTGANFAVLTGNPVLTVNNTVNNFVLVA